LEKPGKIRKSEKNPRKVGIFLFFRRKSGNSADFYSIIFWGLEGGKK
jgi:hypothetical protein